MRKLLTLSIVVAVMGGGVATNTAQAHLVKKPKKHTLESRLASQTVNFRHARFVCRHGSREHMQWACKAVVWLKKEMKETQHVLHAKRVNSLPPVALGRYLAAKKGWTGEQWDCLYHLWGPLESSWRVHADNPTSDAYGIPQALPGSKMGKGWQHSALVQIKWGLKYISGRYGSPCAARSYRLSYGSY